MAHRLSLALVLGVGCLNGSLPKPLNIAALVLIAPAVDMTDKLMRLRFDQAMLKELDSKGVCYMPSDYDDVGYPSPGPD